MGKRTIFTRIGVSILLMCAMLSGCAQINSGQQSEGSAERPVSKRDLDLYVNKLPSLDAVYAAHHVQFQHSFSDEKEGFLEVRKLGDHAGALTDKEKAALKQSIFQEIGSEFPLNISAYTIGDRPGMIGKITSIDQEGRFLVVSTEKYLDKEKKMPDAAWYRLADDAAIEYEGKAIKAEDVAIGSFVKVWGAGLMLTSYPGQTVGLRLEITTKSDGQGDAQGTITALQKEGEGVNETITIEVNGAKYRLLSFAKLWLNSEPAAAVDIRIGDRVHIWHAGYDVGPEKMISQLMIDRP